MTNGNLFVLTSSYYLILSQSTINLIIKEKKLEQKKN